MRTSWSCHFMLPGERLGIVERVCEEADIAFGAEDRSHAASPHGAMRRLSPRQPRHRLADPRDSRVEEIGRASCRERV